jgi:uncharacterized delta-60 repeat protein
MFKNFFALLSLVLSSQLFPASVRAELTTDAHFSPPTFAKVTPSERAVLLPDGKYFLFFDPDTVTDHTASGPLSRFLANGTLDTSFNFSRDYKTVAAVTQVGNGQFYVAATRFLYGAKEVEQILRINGDGSIDAAFNPVTVGAERDSGVWDMVLQPDGKLLVYGSFNGFSGDANRSDIVRLLPNGTIDSSFLPVTASSFGNAFAVTLQADGKILIGGTFTSINGVANPGIARLNTNGSLDSSFQATGFTRSTGAIRGFAIQPDGMILAAGNFRIGSGFGAKRMAVIRLTTAGPIDANFDSSGILPTTFARDLALQPDGKVVALVNSSVYRFNSNGSNDTSFRQPVIVNAIPPTSSAPTTGTPVTLDLYADGRVLVGGIFTDVDPVGAQNYGHVGVVRLNPDGNIDSSLTSSHHTGSEIVPSTFVRLDDGSTLVTFSDRADPAIPYNVARLFDTGAVDPNFSLSSSDPDRFLNNFSARTVERLPDGNFFVYGVDEDTGYAYGKVSAEGVEDTSYTLDPRPFGDAITVAPDGKIFFATGTNPQVTVYTSPNQVVRDGGGTILALYLGARYVAVRPDGHALYQYFSSDEQFHLSGFTGNGALAEVTFPSTDAAPSFPYVFDPSTGTVYQPPNGAWSATEAVQDAFIQPDGRIILVGHFTSYGNTAARGIIRIESTGAVDSSFNPGGGMQWTATIETATFFPTIENIEPTADGKFLITGTFEAFDGVAAPGIARLNADGSVDTSFVAPIHRDKRSRVASAFRGQPDGSFLLSGPYAFTGESTTHSLIRLIDPSAPNPTPTATPTSTPTATATATPTATPTATATATATPSATATATPTSTPTSTPTATPVVGSAANISTRLGVGIGENVLIEGFIVEGSPGSSKKLLVRAIGPSLAQFEVPDPMANPTLEIHDASNAIVATNNDWKTTQVGGLITGNQFAAINATTLAPGNDLESAVIVPLTPGSYTAVVRGVGNTVGTGVVDAYDLDTGSSARLANIATRGLVQPGDGLMIAGFIVANAPVKVVVTATGPSLLQFGVSNALPDTTLELHDQQGALVLENDNWKDTQEQELENIGLHPSHDLEAALVKTIQPGLYTAQVRGKGNDSGVGVVQVFFLQ